MINDKVQGSIKKAHDSHNRLMRLFRSIEKFKDKNVTGIDVNDLEAFPFWEWVNISEGVWFRRRNNIFKEGIISFDTILTKGGKNASESAGVIEEHYHEWLLEACEVSQGEIMDRVTGKPYKTGEIIYFEHNEPHYLATVSRRATLRVMFKRIELA